MKRSNSLSRKSSIPKLRTSSITPNLRGSLNYGRMSLAVAKGGITPSKFNTPVLKARQSVAGASSAKSGISKHGSSHKSKGNIFPVSEAFFKTQSVNAIEEFLIENQYDGIIDRKIICKPTAKEFVSIFKFIYGKIDPLYVLPVRFEDEIPKLLKRLKYKITLTKSVFQTVGSPHSWPSVLAALHWLTKLASQNTELHFTSESSETPAFDLYVTIFQEEERKTEIFQEYERDQEIIFGVTDENWDSLTTEDEKLSSEISELHSTNELESIRQQLSKVVADKIKSINYNDDLDKHIDFKSEEVDRSQGKLDEIAEKQKELSDEYSSLLQKKECQPYTNLEVKKYKETSMEYQYNLNLLLSEKEELIAESEMLEKTVSKLSKTVSEMSLKFNSQSRKLKLDEYQIDNIYQIDPESLKSLGMQIMNASKKGREECSDLLNGTKFKLNELEKLEGDKQAKKSELFKLDCRQKRLEQEKNSLKEESSNLEKYRAEEMEQNDQKIIRLQKQLDSLNLTAKLEPLETLKKEVSALEDEYNELQVKGSAIIQQQSENVLSTLRKLQEDRDNYLEWKKARTERHEAEVKTILDARAKKLQKWDQDMKKFLEEVNE